MLQRTLLLAQRAADDAVNEAQAHARKLIEESEARAQALVGEAESTARRIAEGERRRLEEEISDLSTRRDQLSVDADALDEYVSGYRDRVRSAIEADLERLGNPTIEPPSTRPELHDVELPPSVRPRHARRAADRAGAGASARESIAAEPEPEPDPRLAPSSYADAPRPSETRVAAARRPVVGRGVVVGSVVGRSVVGRDVVGRRVVGRRDVGFGRRTATRRVRRAGGPASASWLSDVESPADVAPGDEPAPWDHLTAEHQPFPVGRARRSRRNAVEGGDDLDDDAFFASLREAVRDEAPLGPTRGAEPVLRRRSGRRAARTLPPPALEPARISRPTGLALDSPTAGSGIDPVGASTGPGCTSNSTASTSARDPVAVTMRGGLHPPGRGDVGRGCGRRCRSRAPCADR